MNKDIIVEELKDWLLPDVENLTLTGKEEELVEDIKVVAKSILAKLDTISQDQSLNLTPEPSEIIAEGEPLKDRMDWHQSFCGKFKSLPKIFDAFPDKVNLHCKTKFKPDDNVIVKIFIKESK